MAIEIHTGAVAARIVWGHPLKAKGKTDQRTRAPILGKDGLQMQEWAFGLAFPRDHFQNHIWPALYQEAHTAFPNGTPRDFAYK